MKNKIEIFGKKVPVIAILIALLVIGTASAAVFSNYATLKGTATVTNNISASLGDGTPINLGGEGVVDFNDEVVFTINNGNEEPIIVNLVTTLTLNNGSGAMPITDEAGLTVDYSVINGTGVEANGTGTLVLVPPGGLTVDVTFDAAGNAMPGEYEVTVAIDYSDEEYTDFTGENAMERVELSYKNDDYNPLDNGKVQVDFAPMGNEFYYEMTFESVELTDYAFIYYADKPDRFNNWGGDNPGAVLQILPTPITDGDMVTGCIDLDMDMPHPNDANYDTDEYCEEFGQCEGGAKLWIIPTNQLTDGTSLPMINWDLEPLLLETDLIHYIDTNIV